MKAATLTGTLLRLIPLDVEWQGETAKFRVEVGDLGEPSHTVSYEPARGRWQAFYIDPTRQSGRTLRTLFETPEDAAAAILHHHLRDVRRGVRAA